MAEMKHSSTLRMFGLLKQAAALDIASPDTCQCLKPPYECFTLPWIRGCAGSLMAEMKHSSTLWTFGLLKLAATLDIASPDTCQCLKPLYEPFTPPWIHPCYNQPRVSRPIFRLETNSTVMWLYAGGVSLILPDVQFGTVSLNWVTFWVCRGHQPPGYFPILPPRK